MKTTVHGVSLQMLGMALGRRKQGSPRHSPGCPGGAQEHLREAVGQTGLCPSPSQLLWLPGLGPSFILAPRFLYLWQGMVMLEER